MIEELLLKLTNIRDNLKTVTSDNVTLYIFKFGEKIKLLLSSFVEKAEGLNKKMDNLSDEFLGARKDYHFVQDITYFQANKNKFDLLYKDFMNLNDELMTILLNLENMRIKNIISVNLDEKINTIEEDLKDINSDIVQIIKALQSAEERINNLEFSFEEFGANVKKIIDDIYNSSLTINDLKSLNSKINSIDMRLSEIPKLVIK
jgi:uncharacterized coiled-coil DUF342 family protein